MRRQKANRTMETYFKKEEEEENFTSYSSRGFTHLGLQDSSRYFFWSTGSSSALNLIKREKVHPQMRNRTVTSLRYKQSSSVIFCMSTHLWCEWANMRTYMENYWTSFHSCAQLRTTTEQQKKFLNIRLQAAIINKSF